MIKNKLVKFYPNEDIIEIILKNLIKKTFNENTDIEVTIGFIEMAIKDIVNEASIGSYSI